MGVKEKGIKTRITHLGAKPRKLEENFGVKKLNIEVKVFPNPGAAILKTEIRKRKEIRTAPTDFPIFWKLCGGRK